MKTKNLKTFIVEELAQKNPHALATGPFGSAISSKFFKESGIPVIRGSNLSSDVGIRLIDKDLVYLTTEKASEFQRSVVRRGDLIFTCWGTINQVGLIDKRSKFSEYIISNKQMKFTPDNSQVDSLFLYYLFSSPLMSQKILDCGIGSSVPGFNLGQLKSMQLHIPPLPTQKAIAHILGTLDDKIELNRRMNETLESIARAIFTSWFIDFDPVRAKAEGRQPEGMDAATAALFPSEFEEVEGQEIPKGWQIKPIGDILEVKGGSTPSTENESYWGGNIPFCTPKDLSNSKTLFILSTERTITELGVGEISSGILPIGTVLLSSRAPIGYVSITIAPISINQGFIALIPNESCNNYFIFEWLKANMELIIGNANGTTFLEISKKNFKPLSLCLPPKKLMQAYSLLINPIFTKIKSNLIQNQELSQTRDTLLPKLLSGELPIDNPEQFTGVS